MVVFGLGTLYGHCAEDVEEAFRYFAPVKSVILGDTTALVEFCSSEHAQHALVSVSGMQILGVAVKVELSVAAATGCLPPRPPPLSLMPTRPLWPPVYELAGESWSLHPGSGGLLYEPLSEFFFSPQSRLYYSCREKCYYSLTFEEGPFGGTPTFHRIEGQTSSVPVPLALAPQVKELLRKKPVILSLTSATATAKAEGLVAPAIRKEEENIAKWAMPRGDEASGKEKQQAQKQKSDAVPPASIVAAAAAALAVKGGLSGGAVCFFCRRLFSGPDMLARHERESTLHAQNIVADAADGAESPSGEAGASAKRPRVAGVVAGVLLAASHEGRFRARSFHAQHPPSPSPPSSPIPPAPPTSLLSDTSNRGHKLLRKMGWSEGRGLGKQEDGAAASLASKSEAFRSHGQSHAGLGLPVVASIPSITYKNGKEAYRSSLKLAAKARFDQLG